MNLKNYTSSVPVDSTIARIERMLMDGGAIGIAKQVSNGCVAAIHFQMPIDAGRAVTVRLPANVEACLDAFWKDHCRTRTVRSRKVRNDFLDQAARTAWKLQQDWVEVQMSLIRLRQQDAVAAFLPHIVQGGATVYERLREENFTRLLPAPSPSAQ